MSSRVVLVVMEWYGRLSGESLRSDGVEFSLLYHAALRPAAPPEYVVPGMVGLTFRLHRRPDERLVFATLIDIPAAVRLGERLGLDAAQAVAFVDSHERVHVHLQLAGVPEEVEEDHSRFVDAVWLSLRHARAEALVRAGEFGLVEQVGPDFWERLVDAAQEAEGPAAAAEGACGHARTELLLEEESPHASDGRTGLMRCLDCDAHLLVDAWQAKGWNRGQDRGRREARVIPEREAQERIARARRGA